MTTKILHENISECCQFTDDIEWQKIIYNCACGKFPKGVKYNNTTRSLYVHPDLPGRKKVEKIQLPPKGAENPEVCFGVLMDVFKNMLSLRSETDIIRDRDEIETVRKAGEVDLDCDWKELKPKTLKNHILINFALSQITLYGLNKKHVNILYRQIQLAFQFKQLTSDDVDYRNGVIIGINHVSFNESEKSLKLQENLLIFHTRQQQKITRITSNDRSMPGLKNISANR